MTAAPIGHAGVAVAGDNFDYRIINAVVSPHLGKDTFFCSMGKVLSVPHTTSRASRVGISWRC